MENTNYSIHQHEHIFNYTIIMYHSVTMYIEELYSIVRIKSILNQEFLALLFFRVARNDARRCWFSAQKRPLWLKNSRNIHDFNMIIHFEKLITYLTEQRQRFKREISFFSEKIIQNINANIYDFAKLFKYFKRGLQCYHIFLLFALIL